MQGSSPIERTSRVYVAGHRGLVGSAVWRHLTREGFSQLVGRTSSELDLRDREDTFTFFAEQHPQVVVLAAARVGGIMANCRQPADFLSDNIRVQVNVLDAAAHFEVERFLFLGSSCIYPRLAAQPIREDALMTGHLEPTNDAYAIAKIAGILHTQALRRQYDRHYISAMPTNLYGVGDNFDLEKSHVLPAMIRRFHEAKVTGAPAVRLWGTGSPRREFLHVEDMARAVLFLLENYDDAEHVNVGVGQDVTIRALAETVARIVGYDGSLEWDSSKPDGMPRKLLDVTKINELGWKAEIGLEDGIQATYDWYSTQEASAQKG
jgi:GDP-L-fucose synthase